jgi:fructose-1,6-bisphosphatase/inositol monophosphatase family enzyme
VSATNELGKAVITTGLPLRGRAPDASGVDLITRLSPYVRDIRRCGSAAIELCMVADGTYDAYFTHALSPWDTVAGAAILLSAGGSFEPVAHPELPCEFGCNSALREPILAHLSAAVSSAVSSAPVLSEAGPARD